MAYCLRAGRPVGPEIQRIIFEEIDSAQRCLTRSKDENRDNNVHEARKSIKKLRGLLRLIQPLIGKSYKKEDRHLRDIGRQLSELRDASAVIEVFEAVVKEVEPQNLLDDQLVQSIRPRLKAHKAEREQNIKVEETLNSVVAALRTLREYAGNYPLENRDFEDLERGLKDTYRRGRKAMALAEKTPTSETFHNWRKRIKDHWYHIRLFGALQTSFIKTREDDLKKLETWLGDDHNLVILREIIEHDRASFGQLKLIQHFLVITKQHGEELRSKAVELGKRLYEPKPKQFVKEFSKAREIWPPESNNDQVRSASQEPASTDVELIAAFDNSRKLRKKVSSAASKRVHAATRV